MVIESLTSTTVQVKDMDIINLTCVLSGSDIQSVSWWKNGKHITSNDLSHNVTSTYINGHFAYGQSIAAEWNVTINLNRMAVFSNCENKAYYGENYTCAAKGGFNNASSNLTIQAKRKNDMIYAYHCLSSVLDFLSKLDHE